jgi:FKBP-type peptidyl-prolyl cis-trans isomerase SlyD
MPLVSSFQVGPETFVTLAFQVFDAEGEPASGAEIVGVVFGMGGLLPAVDRAIEGKSEGDTVEVVLQPAEAYGKRDPRAIVEVDRGDFPTSVAPGDRFEMENDEGGILVVHVLDVQDDVVVMDTNHPLAGQEIHIRLEIQEVRPATSEELAASEALLDEDSIGISPGAAPISPERLIRGGARG